MTEADLQVDFYHLHSDSSQRLLQFCCRLIDKTWQLGHRIIVLLDDDHQAEQLDKLLWTFRDDSFLPHAFYSAEQPESSAVCLARELPAKQDYDLLVNLSQQVPLALESGTSGFSRIVEIINQEPSVKQHGRIRYSYYDKCNVSLKYHEITSG